MKVFPNILRTLVTVAGVSLLIFNASLFMMCNQQRVNLKTVYNQLVSESALNRSNFEEYKKKIAGLESDLHSLKQQLEDTRLALAAELEKRKQFEIEHQAIKSSVQDISATINTLKEDMKAWQKDYVSVLAKAEGRNETSEEEIKKLWAKMNSENISELKDRIVALQLAVEKIKLSAGSNK